MNKKAKYRVNKKNNKYEVIEKENDIVLKTFKRYIEAKQMQLHLNFGGGFDGCTPEFMRERKDLYK